MPVDYSLFPKKEEGTIQAPPPQGVDLSLFPEPKEPQQPQEVEKPVSLIQQMHEEMAQQREAGGRVAVGGVLKMAEGLAALPFELAEIGEPEWKDYTTTAEKIRKHFPSIKPETTTEEVGQLLIQYGVPAATGIKLMDKVVKGTPWAVRFVADVLSGGIADFLVADPAETTLGDIIGGPTAKKEGEKAIVTRAKIAAEGSAISAPLIPVGAVVGGAAKWVTTRLLPTDKMIMGALSSTFEKMTLDSNTAIKNIQDSLNEYADSGFKPTTGTASKDPGIVSFEKAAATQNKFAQSGARMTERKQINLQHISDELERVTKQMGGDPEDAVEFFYKYIDNVISGKKGVYEETLKQLDGAKADTKDLINDIAEQSKLEPKISAFLNQTATDELNRITGVKNNLYRSIDPEHSEKIPKTRLMDAYSVLVGKTGPLDSVPSKIPTSVKKIKKILENDKEILTFGDLQDYIPDISEAISNARFNNQGGVVKRLTQFKDVLSKESEYLAIEGSPLVAERAVKANKFYKEEYVPKFKEFVGDNFRKAIRKDSPWPESDFARHFLGIRSGSQEAATQLDTIIKSSDNAEVAQKSAEDYIVGILAEQMYGIEKSSGAISKIDKFLNTREIRDTLKQFPEAKQKILEYRKGLISRDLKETSLGYRVESAKKFLSFTEKEINLNAAKWFVDKNPIVAMKRVFDSPNPEKAMDQLLMLAKQDNSGKAKEGLRVALNNLLESPVGRGGLRGSQELKSGKNFEVYNAKLRNFIEYEPTRKAIEQLYTPHEMKVLSDLHKKIRVMDRINMQVTRGSPTAILEESVRSGQVLAFSMFGIVKGRGIFMVSRKLQQILGRDPVEKAWSLLTDAMLDPELAKTMLLKASETNMPKIKSRLTAHMINNYVTVGGAE